MSVMNLHRRQDGESRLASESDASLINTGFFSPFTGRAAGIQSLQASISKRLCRTVSETSVRQVFERCGVESRHAVKHRDCDATAGDAPAVEIGAESSFGQQASRTNLSRCLEDVGSSVSFVSTVTCKAGVASGHRSPFAPLTYPEMP